MGMCDVLRYMFTFNLDISQHYIFKVCNSDYANNLHVSSCYTEGFP
jgi:hypothetical protein